MKVMVIGSGAREHALVWKLRQSPLVRDIFAAPGNAGTSAIATNISVSPDDLQALARVAQQYRIDLTVVGPEAPLAAGIVDVFEGMGLTIFGPSKAASQLEASKIFAKTLMQRYSIPCARGSSFTRRQDAVDFISKMPPPVVVKADGLAAGKGVVVASSKEEAMAAVDDFMVKKTLGKAGEKVIVEECLTGREVSLLAFSDGRSLLPMVPACDYKRALDGDMGPNTGGMGSYSPPTFFSQPDIDYVCRNIMEPVIQGLANEGSPYRGVLYAGLMVTPDGPKVLEFNVRFGDPETQVILPRLKGDLAEIMLASVQGKLAGKQAEWSTDAAVGVVLASGGYPGKYQTGLPISGLDQVDSDVVVFHAGTSKKNGIVTAGGRVLTVVAGGPSIAAARSKVYASIPLIQFEGCHYRKDIAERI